MDRQIFLCEDSLEGIFTGVYEAWASRCGHGNVELRTREPENLEFFCVYHRVQPDGEKAEKVLRTIRKRLGWGIYGCLCYAAWAADERKGTAIYRTVVDFLSVHGAMYNKPIPSGVHPGGTGSNFLENQGNPAVRLVSSLQRQVGIEYNHYQGFLRFRETEKGILFAPIRPKANLLVLLAEHFADRFPRERWFILDTGRGTAAAHEPGKGFVLYTGLDITRQEIGEIRDAEEDFAGMWRTFCTSIAIESRRNPGLQRQNLALHFREYIDEFHKV